jgi:hypothetical protein
MKTIWKYELPVDDACEIRMPEGATVLCVQVQFGRPHIWALVNSGHTLVPRQFRTVGTGHPLPEKLGVYVGTYQVSGGNLVFHVFEIS